MGCNAQANMPAATQRLIYKGKVLKDEQTLASIGAHRLREAGEETASLSLRERRGIEGIC